VEAAAVPWCDLRGEHTGESTATVRERVRRAQERQMTRQACLNSRLDGRALREVCRSVTAIDALLSTAMARHHLSVRGVYRILRVARTIADLAGAAELDTCHVAEALQFRMPAACV
jgi:magnesium chelatase family protein